jgi:hypothetical protein
VVWVIGAEDDERLRGFDGDSGAPVVAGPAAGAKVRRFQPPIVSGGRIYVGTEGGVRAYVW